MPFLDRQKELAALERAWASGRAEMVILYGRRRVGKSELLSKFLLDKPHIYYVGTRKVERDLLAEFTEQVHRLTREEFLLYQPFQSWDAALSYLAGQASNQRLVLALDEFSYLCDVNPALPSIVQRWWDQTARHLPVVLVLCGSYVSFMEHLALESGELYGRRTRQLLLQPFDYYDASRFFASYLPEDRLRAYAVLGGMPAYLAAFSEAMSLSDNISQHMLYAETFLGQEARWILLEELRAERVYHSILRAIAHGKTRPSEIASAVGLESANRVSPYLERLRDLRLVERRVPVTDDPERPGRRGLYALADHYLRFWYRFIEDNQSYLELGMQDLVLREKILPHLDHYVSKPGFELACAQFLWRHLALGRLPVRFDRLGAWWNDREEIDLVALDGKRVVLVGECKWTDAWVKLGDLAELQRKASLFGATPDITYALFSRSGFDPNLIASADAEHLLLYTVSDLFQLPEGLQKSDSQPVPLLY